LSFPRIGLQQVIAIGNLISLHYFEYAKGYVFEGEEHDFWEFLYVDKGEVEVRADDRTLELRQGQIIFHKPHEFHTVRVHQQHTPPNLIVMAFESLSPAMSAFEGCTFELGNRERELLAHLVQEGFRSFEPPYNDPASHVLVRKADAPLGSEQLMKAYLEVLLISLARRAAGAEGAGGSDKLSTMRKERDDRQLAESIVGYMGQHLSESLSLDEIGRAFHLGKSRLKDVIQTHTGMGVLEYYKHLKIEQAKTMIREHQANYTEIAERLGYAGIHYFSRDFKKRTGMSPTEYSRSVQARMSRS
jgi:AraC-like DNA-binding protein